MGKGNSGVRGTFRNVLSLNSSPSEMKSQKAAFTADVPQSSFLGSTSDIVG